MEIWRRIFGALLAAVVFLAAGMGCASPMDKYRAMVEQGQFSLECETRTSFVNKQKLVQERFLKEIYVVVGENQYLASSSGDVGMVRVTLRKDGKEYTYDLGGDSIMAKPTGSSKMLLWRSYMPAVFGAAEGERRCTAFNGSGYEEVDGKKLYYEEYVPPTEGKIYGAMRGRYYFDDDELLGYVELTAAYSMRSFSGKRVDFPASYRLIRVRSFTPSVDDGVFSLPKGMKLLEVH